MIFVVCAHTTHTPIFESNDPSDASIMLFVRLAEDTKTCCGKGDFSADFRGFKVQTLKNNDVNDV